MSSRIATLLAVLLAAVALAPALARADGDPASDVLLGSQVFYPYTPPDATVQRSLNSVTADAKRAGFPIKVALIGHPVDLGVIPDLFGKPQEYANFLDQEISFQGGKQPLLVVMSTGYGVQGLSPKVTAAAAALRKPSGATANDLGTAAVSAVQKLASASGHPIAGAGTSSSSSSSSSTILIVALAAAALLTAIALVVVTVRRRRTAA